MERRFSIEAKSFCFSIKVGFSDLRLEERRKNFVGFIFASAPCAAWLMDSVEAASQVKEDISKSYREGDKVLMVHGGSNKAGRYLEVSVYVEGGRKGVIWIPEGRFGRGWRRFAGELRLMLVSPNVKSGSEDAEFRRATSSQISSAMHAGVGVHEGSPKARSFVEVLQSKPSLERSRGEAEKSRAVKPPVVEETRSAMAAVSVRKTSGCSVQDWVSRLLGFFQKGLGRVWAALLEGLLYGPKDWSLGKRIRALLKGFKARGLRKCGLGFLLKPKRWTRPVRRIRAADFQSPPPLPAPEVRMEVAEAEPPSVRSAVVGSSPVSTSTFQPALVVPPSMDLAGSPVAVAPSQADPLVAHSQAEPSGVGLPVQVHQVGVAEEGSQQLRIPLGPASEAQLGVDEAEPHEQVRSAAVGSSPVSSFALQSASVVPPAMDLAGVSSEPSVVVTPVGLSEVIIPSPAESSGDLTSPLHSVVRQITFQVEPSADPFQATQMHQVGDAVEGSQQVGDALEGSQQVGNSASHEVCLFPWEEDLPGNPWEEVSDSRGEDFVEAPVIPPKADCCPTKAPSLIQKGFFGPRAAYSSPSGKDPKPVELIKNKELIADKVANMPTEGYPKEVIRTFNFAPVVGLSWGGEDKRMLNLLSEIEKEKRELAAPKVKGKRELKNLECSLNFEASGKRSSQAKCQRRQGSLGSKNVLSFPPEVQ
jgi:hypothetical protein